MSPAPENSPGARAGTPEQLIAEFLGCNTQKQRCTLPWNHLGWKTSLSPAMPAARPQVPHPPFLARKAKSRGKYRSLHNLLPPGGSWPRASSRERLLLQRAQGGEMGLAKAGAWSPSQPADTTRAPASLSLGGQPVPPNLTQVPSVTSTTGRQ